MNETNPEFALGDMVRRRSSASAETGKIDQIRPSAAGPIYHVVFANSSLWCVPGDLVIAQNATSAPGP
jgi:hypothetical protein